MTMDKQSPYYTLLLRAEEEPLNVDISSYSDEFCAGFLAGQVNVIEEVEAGRVKLPTPEERLASVLGEIEGKARWYADNDARDPREVDTTPSASRSSTWPRGRSMNSGHQTPLPIPRSEREASISRREWERWAVETAAFAREFGAVDLLCAALRCEAVHPANGTAA